MNIEEAIQSIQSLYSKGVQSKNTRLSDRQIYNSLITARSTVLQQQVTKRQKINDNCYQILPCVELEKLPVSTKSGMMILQSKYELPKPIATLDKLLIQYVTNLDGDIRYDKTEFENVKYMVGNKFTGNKPKFYFKNGKLNITVLTMLKAVSVSVLIEDPIGGAMFPTCDDCTECKCQDVYELDFYTDRNTFKSVSILAQEELIRLFGQMKEDKNANAVDDFETAGKMIHQ